MPIIQHVFYQKAANAAVLYSIVKTDINNNQYREFWLARPGKDDVLLDTIFPYFEYGVGWTVGVGLSDTQDAGVQASWSASASLVANSFPSGVTNVFQVIEGNESDVSTSGSGSIYRENDLSFTWSGNVAIDDENTEADSSWVDSASVNYFTNALSLTYSSNVSGSATNLNNAGGDGDTGVDVVSGNAAVRINVDSQPDGYTESNSDTWSVTKSPNSNRTMPAEGYLSNRNGTLVVLVKAQGTDFSGGKITEWTSVLYGPLDDITGYTEYINETDLEPLANGDWRQPIVNEFSSSNTGILGCAGVYLLNPLANIQGGKLYRVNGSLSQLESALKTAGTGSVSAQSVRIDTATDNPPTFFFQCALSFEDTISVDFPGIPSDAELLSAVYLP